MLSRKKNKRRRCERCNRSFFAKDKPPSESHIKFYCSKSCSKLRERQAPNKKYTFGCGHSARLPAVGQCTELAKWIPNNTGKNCRRGGSWSCQPCLREGARKRARGESRQGILARMKSLIWRIQGNAKDRGYVGVVDAPERAVELWHAQKGKCAACACCIVLVGGNNCNLDHCHRTGKLRGFLCRSCNLAEGLLARYSTRQFNLFCNYRSKHAI